MPRPCSTLSALGLARHRPDRRGFDRRHLRPVSPVGDFDAHGDVGAPKIAGSAAYNPVSQDYTLTAGGTNMWAQRDEFHFVWKRMTGDFILQTRVELIGKGVDPHRKAGLIVRAGLDADAPYADGVVHGDGLTSLQFRRTKGAITEESRPDIKGADVLQLERKGTTFTFSAAKFGEPFVTTEVKDLDLGDEVLVGLALCSHNPDVVERAIFSNVRIIRPAKDGFVPYRDYIGSVLELLDVQSGRRQAIHRAEQPFEAPNWTPDGRALIYNGSGRGDVRGKLFRFDLATRQPVAIDTGTSNRNNNDHVLSFDGTMLGISDQSAGQSAIYTLPAAGCPPERVARRRARQAHHAADAVVPARMVARRQAAGLHRRPQRRVRHLHHRVGRIGHRAEHDEEQGPGRRSGVSRPTASSSTSTRRGAGRCSCGG